MGQAVVRKMSPTEGGHSGGNSAGRAGKGGSCLTTLKMAGEAALLTAQTLPALA